MTAVLLMAGCTPEPGTAAPPAAPSGSEASEEPAAATPTLETPPPPSGSTSPAAPAVEVAVQGTTFTPTEIEVPARATVAWRNALPIRHTVTAGTREAPMPERFDRELVDPEQVVTATVTQTTPYFCRIHAGMQGVITVSR